MTRCSDCGKRLFLVFGRARCGPCQDVRDRDAAEKTRATTLRRRDALNARSLFPRMLRGAWRGALHGMGAMLDAVSGIVTVVTLSDGPGPRLPLTHADRMHIVRWLILTVVGYAVLCLYASPFRPDGPVWLLFVWYALPPFGAAAFLGAWFGARRAAVRDWSWWFGV